MIPRKEYSKSVWTDHHEGAVIVEKMFTHFPSLVGMEFAIQEAIENSNDVIGFVAENRDEAVEISISKSRNLNGYINGWEYLGGDSRNRLSSFTADIDACISESSLLTCMSSSDASNLDLVMKWIFLSRGAAKSQSSWHADPIGSAAWMIQLVGSKEWKTADGKSGIIFPGDMIIIPPGLEHCVINIGIGENIAVSHNWIPVGNLTSMWSELDRALLELHAFLNEPGNFYHHILPKFHSHTLDRIDSLLFGLLMVFIHQDRGLELFQKFSAPPNVIEDWIHVTSQIARLNS